uniref:Uncharacterized protein n=1 Tax=viral metagenome TaxID=1070528 RepID=A0A6H1ZCZ1_9ZZZZ
MKRPEKKKEEGNPLEKFGVLHYNQACDDYEKFLPDEEEILEIFYVHACDDEETIARAISERIGKCTP